MKKRTFIFLFTASSLLIACNNSEENAGNEDENTAQNDVTSENDVAPEDEQTEEAKGRAFLKVGELTFEGTTFLTDQNSPSSNWADIPQVDSDELQPTMAMEIQTISPNQMMISLGLTGEKVKDRKLEGDFSLNTDTENPFVISVIIDDGMKNYTFSDGTVTISELIPEHVNLTAEGTGMYSDFESGEVMVEKSASFELELNLPNIFIDGETIKQFGK